MKPTQEDMDRHLRDLAGNIRTNVNALMATGDPEAFGVHMADLLEMAHTRAVVLGRHLAGDDFAEEADDRAFARLVMNGDGGEIDFLAAFVSDIADGRYTADDGTLVVSRIERRALMYTGRVVGTANEAFVLASDEDETWDWVLGKVNSCSVCPERAQGGPYATEDLPGYPGDNSTPCVFNCGCRLLRSDGTESFYNPDGDEEAA